MTTPRQPPTPQGRVLCIRCEHRAHYLETGHARRYECGEDVARCGCCYMYRPVVPMAVVRSPSDRHGRRAAFGPWMFSARVVAAPRKPDGDYRLRQLGRGGMVAYWEPATPAERKRCNANR